MNEQSENIEYEFLWKLLANPADATHSYIFNLQSLVGDYPQSGLLRALLMPNGDKRNLKHAAAYFNPGILYKLATAPESLPFVTNEQVVQSDAPPPVPADTYFHIPVTEPFVPPVIADEPVADFTTIEDDTTVEEENAPTEENVPVGQDAPEAEIEPAVEQEESAEKVTEEIPIVDTIAEQEKIIADYLDDDNETEAAEPATEVYDYPVEEPAVEREDEAVSEDEHVADDEPLPQQAIAQVDDALPLMAEVEPEGNVETAKYDENSLAREYDAYMAKEEDLQANEEEPVYPYEDKMSYFHQDIDDEIYDEIVSIEDIGLEQLAIINRETEGHDVAPAEAAESESGEPAENKYFVFEPEIEEDNTTIAVSENVPAVIAQTKAPGRDEDKSNLARYNDEKMPYSFMWWLDKTRKEHADIYQPYVSNNTPVVATAKKREVADELQQQYYENIVSISSADDIGQKAAPKADHAQSPRKEDKIIERFIQEEPQIKHPSGVKLDNENKARKSSEDKDELVTETLARIYTEQMLYHKAILTYKKLMLKYPEKSLYFAGQIEQLESKIN